MLITAKLVLGENKCFQKWILKATKFKMNTALKLIREYHLDQKKNFKKSFGKTDEAIYLETLEFITNTQLECNHAKYEIGILESKVISYKAKLKY